MLLTILKIFINEDKQDRSPLGPWRSRSKSTVRPPPQSQGRQAEARNYLNHVLEVDSDYGGAAAELQGFG